MLLKMTLATSKWCDNVCDTDYWESRWGGSTAAGRCFKCSKRFQFSLDNWRL